MGNLRADARFSLLPRKIGSKENRASACRLFSKLGINLICIEYQYFVNKVDFPWQWDLSYSSLSCCIFQNLMVLPLNGVWLEPFFVSIEFITLHGNTFLSPSDSQCTILKCHFINSNVHHGVH